MDAINGFFANYPIVNTIFTTVIIVVVGILLTRVLTALVQRTLERSRLEKAAHSLILSLTKVALYLLVGLSAASNLGIDVTGIVALASVLTLALSLALQDMVSNVIGGFTILTTHPFHSGDYVEISGQGGTVREINMTYTMLSTSDNKLVSIPNKSVVAAEIVNYSALGTRRMEITVSAVSSVPTQKVIDALVQAGTVDNALLDPAPSAVITGYSQGAIDYALRVWAKGEDYWGVHDLILQRIKTIFDEQGIPMPAPGMAIRLER